MSESSARKTQTEFHVARGDNQLGPWDLAEIAARMASQELAVTDFIYLESRAEWIPLMECDELRVFLRQSRPKAPPQKAMSTELASVVTPAKTKPAAPPVEVAARVEAESTDQWFIQKGVNRYGPLTYLEVVQALQDKTVYDFDFVCQRGTENWIRVAEHEAFHLQAIRDLAQKVSSSTTSTGVFNKRQYPRRPFASDVIVHDERSAWVGRSYEASAGGSGLVIQNSTLRPGQIIKLHFAPVEGLPAFNALGEIVGKKYSKEVNGLNSPVQYAVRFLQIGAKGSAVENQVREHLTATGSGK